MSSFVEQQRVHLMVRAHSLQALQLHISLDPETLSPFQLDDMRNPFDKI